MEQEGQFFRHGRRRDLAYRTVMGAGAFLRIQDGCNRKRPLDLILESALTVLSRLIDRINIGLERWIGLPRMPATNNLGSRTEKNSVIVSEDDFCLVVLICWSDFRD